MLECVINISEGQDSVSLEALKEACSPALLDVHSDAHHNRTVFTLGGPVVEEMARALTLCAIDHIDLNSHAGAHPRFGAVDVVPFVPVPHTESSMEQAIVARNDFAKWLGELGVPTFLYGPERSLPEVRRTAFSSLAPSFGPAHPHSRAGATAVGARPVLIAYNLWLQTPDIGLARTVARSIRSPNLRTLAIPVGSDVQVSCNLVNPSMVGPDEAYEAVRQHAAIARAELVGLIPEEVLRTTEASRWKMLDIDEGRTIEGRLAAL